MGVIVAHIMQRSNRALATVLDFRLGLLDVEDPKVGMGLTEAGCPHEP